MKGEVCRRLAPVLQHPLVLGLGLRGSPELLMVNKLLIVNWYCSTPCEWTENSGDRLWGLGFGG